MHYTLKGKIARAHPYQLDPSLSIYGAGAEAEATGKAINAVKKTAEDHIAREDNPHKVTKSQVGLGNVDNTSDNEKPISVLQAAAIAEAKKAGTDAHEAANNAQKAADNAQTAADNAQTAADNAQVTADNAQSSADNALTESKEYTDSKHKDFTVTLTAEGWTGDKAPFTQTVAVEGILETDKPHWGLVYSDDVPTSQEDGEPEESGADKILELNLAEKDAYAYVDDLETAEGSVTFTCFEDKPEVDLTIQMEVNR